MVDPTVIARNLVNEIVEAALRDCQEKTQGNCLSKKTIEEWKCKYPWVIVGETADKSIRLCCNFCE